MTIIRLEPSGQQVPCAGGDTVLGALERAGYALPNNCRAGACGECKVRVVTGSYDQGMVLDMALTPAERAAGYGLMCMAKPTGAELAIEWGTPDAKPKLFPPREGQRYVLTDRVTRTPRIVELTLRPVAAPMRYWPGQYVTVGGDVPGIPQRCYSVANAPRPDGEITLHVTRVDGGATSAWLHAREIGEVLKVSGPYGTFIGDPAVETPVLCLAAGSGLAPIRALTEAALRRGFRKPVTLLFSARTRADLYEQGLMRWWQTKHRHFNYRATLTQEQAPDCLSGRLPALLPGLFPDLSGHSVFVAGTPGFVEACVQAVRELGVPADRLHTEGFTAQTPV